jgi:heme-degrading monooxygenase HmoA
MQISKESHLVTLINVFETTPEQLQTLIDQWIRFTELVRNEPGYVGTALHKSTDGTRMINYAHWRSQTDFDAFVKRHGADFAQFLENASRMDPHTYEVAWLDEPTRS